MRPLRACRTRRGPLVKSLMRVLSLLMGRRRVHVPKALRKQVLDFWCSSCSTLKNPTEQRKRGWNRI